MDQQLRLILLYLQLPLRGCAPVVPEKDAVAGHTCIKDERGCLTVEGSCRRASWFDASESAKLLRTFEGAAGNKDARAGTNVRGKTGA